MFCPFLPVNGLNFAEIGMAWVDLSEPRVHVCLHRPELRFTKNADRAKRLYMWDFSVLYKIPRDFTRLLAYFVYLPGLASTLQ